MSITTKNTSNFSSSIGTPDDNTKYNEIDMGAVFTNLKIIVSGAPLGFSLDGRETHGELPIGVHDFLGIRISKIFLRKIASTVNLYGFNVDP